MPNWCSITMGFAMRDMPKILNSKREVDFNIIAPMPQSLNVESGSINKEQVLCFLSEKLTKPITNDVLRDAEVLDDMFSSHTENEIITICDRLRLYEEETINRLYDVGKILIENKKAYGHTDWYDFHIEEWDTKWNACNTDVDETIGYEPDDIVTVRFDTAWTYPEDWLRKLSEMGVVFYLEYEIEGDYHGEVYYDGDLFITNVLDDANVYDDETGYWIGVDETKYQYDRMMPNLKDWIYKTSPEIKVLATNVSIEELIES